MTITDIEKLEAEHPAPDVCKTDRAVRDLCQWARRALEAMQSFDGWVERLDAVRIGDPCPLRIAPETLSAPGDMTVKNLRALS